MDIYRITTQEILERISRHCPDSLFAYLQCINRAGSKGTVYFSRQTIEDDMSLGFTKFKNAIKKLAIENLLEWHPFDGGLSITLMENNEEE